MKDALGWVYDQIASALHHHVRQPVFYDDDLGRPGFLIFPRHQDFRKTEQQWAFVGVASVTPTYWIRTSGRWPPRASDLGPS